MTYSTVDGLEFFQFDLFRHHDLVHGIFTRHGGASPEPWNSLNLGGTVGDARENVIENRRRIFAAFNRPVRSVFDVWQVHSNDVVVSEIARPLDQPHRKGDAILTSSQEVTLFMRFADCVPVLLFDPVHRVAGIAHAGWQGTVSKIVEVTVKTMAEIYGTKPVDILAGIGPSIGPDHYEIGHDVVSRVQQAFGNHSGLILAENNGRTYFDLWEANRLTLQDVGVEQIETAGICTACDLTRWYSHRGERGKTGRFGALIALN